MISRYAQARAPIVALIGLMALAGGCGRTMFGAAGQDAGATPDGDAGSAGAKDASAPGGGAGAASDAGAGGLTGAGGQGGSGGVAGTGGQGAAGGLAGTAAVPTGGAGGAASFSISGYLVGAHGAPVTLVRGPDSLTVTGDGAFTFPTRLGDGARYLVQLWEEPTDQSCSIQGASGTVHAMDVVDVAVTCLSNDPRLAALSVSPGGLSPAFDPDITSYGIPRLATYQPSVVVRATPRATDAIVTIGGIDVEPGAAIEVPLVDGPQVIHVNVTTASGATLDYAVGLTRIPLVYAKASNNRASIGYGRALAASGQTLAVAAEGDSSGSPGVNGDQLDTGAPYSGAVHVLVERSGSWTQEAYVKASRPRSNDLFGNAVALDGDRLVVGAPGESSPAGSDGLGTDVSADNAGAVYVFERTAGIWAQTAYLKASNAASLDSFGGAVAVRGRTIVVGAPNQGALAADSTGDTSGAGAVYVFEQGPSGAWTETASLKASNAGSGDDFGAAIAFDGNTIVVGAANEASSTRGVDGPGDNDDAPSAGAAYLFERASPTAPWAQTAFLKASNARRGAAFGGSVAIDQGTVVVGSLDELSSGTGVNGDQYGQGGGSFGGNTTAGAAYVFERVAGAVAQTTYLKAPTISQGFGIAVAISSDVILAGTQTSYAYAYARSADTWALLASLRKPGGGGLAARVALDGKLMAVWDAFDSGGGAGVNPPATTAVASYSGAVYIFERP